MPEPVLQPKELGLPDITTAGNLSFSAICDRGKAFSILKSGIRPRKGEKESASYFPGVVSLSAISPKGYAETTGITMGWWPLLSNTLRTGDVDSSRAYYYSFILDPDWIADNIKLLLGVGRCFEKQRFREGYSVGPLSELPISESRDEYKDTFFEEVHYKNGTIPIEAIRGVVVDEEQKGRFAEGLEIISNTLNGLKANQSPLRFPIGLYNKQGQIIALVG